ncbi:MAG: aminodeoxychorismate/anthranilate synthase component II [Paracoccaceae bacterium]|jgi:anthranilate synthase component 2|nr:aminodeoxychorismate/anthranilate synthase component II [Paracoccaceae bacterium]
MILMIDNYDSFTYNLVQYLGQLGANVKVIRNDIHSVADLLALKPTGIVIGPGPCTPSEAGVCIDLIKEVAKTHVPLLGVCLGHQAIGEAFGGTVIRHSEISHGKVANINHNKRGVFKNLNTPFKATRYHSLVVDLESFPDDVLEVTASLQDGTIMGLTHKDKDIFGVQFHPESIASENGHTLLQNFLDKIESKGK